MDKIKLIKGDALEKLKSINNNSVDLIVSDPPYNLSKDYKSTKDNMSFKKFIDFSKKWLNESNRILKPGGTMYVFMGMKLIAYIYQIMDQDLNMNFSSWITWHYTQGLGKRKGYSSRHDDILMFTKKDGKPTFNLDNIRVPQKYYRSVNNMRGANPGNVWNFSHVHYSQSNRRKHPTQKPEGVIERMILASSNVGDLVLDPFSGSGTTMRVVQQTNRKGIGIEIDPTFVEETKERLKESFNGFDSIDPRMLRVPNDLNNKEVRSKYFVDHIHWFLGNHESAIKDYFESFKNKYEKHMDDDEINLFNKTVLSYDLKNKTIPKHHNSSITLF